MIILWSLWHTLNNLAIYFCCCYYFCCCCCSCYFCCCYYFCCCCSYSNAHTSNLSSIIVYITWSPIPPTKMVRYAYFEPPFQDLCWFVYCERYLVIPLLFYQYKIIEHKDILKHIHQNATICIYRPPFQDLCWLFVYCERYLVIPLLFYQYQII